MGLKLHYKPSDLAFQIWGTNIIHALNYGESRWGETAKIIVQLSSRQTERYFLKVGFTIIVRRMFVFSRDDHLGGRSRRDCSAHIQRKFRIAQRDISTVALSSVPRLYAEGKYSRNDPETCFLLAESQEFGDQKYLISWSRFRYIVGGCSNWFPHICLSARHEHAAIVIYATLKL